MYEKPSREMEALCSDTDCIYSKLKAIEFEKTRYKCGFPPIQAPIQRCTILPARVKKETSLELVPRLIPDCEYRSSLSDGAGSFASHFVSMSFALIPHLSSALINQLLGKHSITDFKL
ncbi:5466_t:CDS:2 [Diversispora eburnea]|uniref:5466_t:CDS:1 n=1 Tax=Diversispora eburnea TaxID=1213867 RepID=A0A9N8VFU8_9GLOM|nr:5466_t:CDS:2 [Diversispora eburnea]